MRRISLIRLFRLTVVVVLAGGSLGANAQRQAIVKIASGDVQPRIVRGDRLDPGTSFSVSDSGIVVLDYEEICGSSYAVIRGRHYTTLGERDCRDDFERNDGDAISRALRGESMALQVVFTYQPAFHCGAGPCGPPASNNIEIFLEDLRELEDDAIAEERAERARVEQMLAAYPSLIAYYKFDSSLEATGVGESIRQCGASFTENALYLNGIGYCEEGGHETAVLAPKLDYHHFTVAFDFKAMELGGRNGALLYGGPSYRWFGLDTLEDGRLSVSFNQRNFLHVYERSSLQTGSWHSLIVSVNLRSGAIRSLLDGRQLEEVRLPAGFALDVIGTIFEEHDRKILFTDQSSGDSFHGLVDNFRLFGRSMSYPELNSLYSQIDTRTYSGRNRPSSPSFSGRSGPSPPSFSGRNGPSPPSLFSGGSPRGPANENPLANASNLKVTLRSADSGFYMSRCNGCVPNGPHPDNASVHVNNPSAQYAQWYLTQLSNGNYTLRSVDSGRLLSRCRNCAPSSLPDSVFVHTTNPSAGWAQWKIERQPSGNYALRSADTGKYAARCNNCIHGGYASDNVFVHVDNPSAGYAQWDIRIVR